MSKYLYKLRSYRCKCKHENSQHKLDGSCAICACEVIERDNYEVEADSLGEALEKVNRNVMEVGYFYKYKL